MVPAGRGFLVKANASGQTATLNPSVKHNGEETPSIGPLLRIDVDGEQAFIKLAQGVNMPLLNPKGHCSSVYLALNGNPYIMIATEQPKDIELCFQPKKNGQHRLRLTAENADLDYLHLIDRSTGADIDLLQHPNYGFESGPNDQAERFQLLFSPR